MTGLEPDWPQIAAALTSLAMVAAAFAFAVRLIVRQEIAPKLDRIHADLANGPMNRRIDDRVDVKVAPLQEKTDHIDQQLAKNLPGYKKAG